MKSIYDLSFNDISDVLRTWKEPDYRSLQLWQGLYKHFWNSALEFSQFSKPLKESLFNEYSFHDLEVIKKEVSSDGMTEKVLFKLADDYKIETVLMEYKKRQTICVSTQSGCPAGCVFCATGQMGFNRNLSIGEIVSQVLYYSRYLDGIGKKLTNVVLMGMGEPFLNYANTLSAVARLNDPRGYNFGSRRFTISTVGILPKLQIFISEKHHINLAISLHSIDDEIRSRLLPITKNYSVKNLLEICKQYTTATGRRISFEWAMINGINDSDKDARSLARLLHGMNCHVNIIPLNATIKYLGKASPREKLYDFRDILVHNGIKCTIRLHRGIDIGAGCGQLAERNI
jgi:23S rRNA (adenine2503-C2)-methyltransferase